MQVGAIAEKIKHMRSADEGSGKVTRHCMLYILGTSHRPGTIFQRDTFTIA